MGYVANAITAISNGLGSGEPSKAYRLSFWRHKQSAFTQPPDDIVVIISHSQEVQLRTLQGKALTIKEIETVIEPSLPNPHDEKNPVYIVAHYLTSDIDAPGMGWKIEPDGHVTPEAITSKLFGQEKRQYVARQGIEVNSPDEMLSIAAYSVIFLQSIASKATPGSSFKVIFVVAGESHVMHGKVGEDQKGRLAEDHFPKAFLSMMNASYVANEGDIRINAIVDDQRYSWKVYKSEITPWNHFRGKPGWDVNISYEEVEQIKEALTQDIEHLEKTKKESKRFENRITRNQHRFISQFIPIRGDEETLLMFHYDDDVEHSTAIATFTRDDDDEVLCLVEHSHVLDYALDHKKDLALLITKQMGESGLISRAFAQSNGEFNELEGEERDNIIYLMGEEE